jgi:hypothetical protein
VMDRRPDTQKPSAQPYAQVTLSLLILDLWGF